MTEKEFFEYNKAKNMPKFNIGQGMGYKSDTWEDYDGVLFLLQTLYISLNVLMRQTAQ